MQDKEVNGNNLAFHPVVECSNPAKVLVLDTSKPLRGTIKPKI